MSDKQKGYTKEQLRIAFRHGCWLGIAAMDESVGPDDVTDAVIQSMNEWFDDWYVHVDLQPGFTAAGTTTTTEKVKKKENNEENSEDDGGNINDRAYDTR